MAVRNPLIVQPWALAGDVATIPVVAQPDGSVSFNQGWGPDYQADPATDPDAKPVERTVMNGVLNTLTANLLQYQREGVPEFIAAADNAGVPVAYPLGIMVMWRALPADPWRVYLNTVTNNVNIPSHASWLDLTTRVSGSVIKAGDTGIGPLGLAASPPQFDNDLSIPSTAFTKRMGVEFNTWLTITGTVVLTAAYVGRPLQLASASPFPLTLPLAASVPSGVTLTFKNTGAGVVTLAPASGDIMSFGTTNPLSVTVGLGEDLQLASNGADGWFALSGSAQTKYTSGFGFLNSANGWQRLPSGLLLQWGRFSSANAAPSSVVFPTLFAGTEPFQVLATGRQASSGLQAYVTVNSQSASGAVFSCFNAASGVAPVYAAAGAVSVSYLAIGV